MKKKILLIVWLCSTLFLLNLLHAKPKGMSSEEYSLYKAAYMGRLRKVERLLEKGVNPSVKSPNSKRTPLHIACTKGRFKIVKCLVEKGADLDAKNEDGKTPLQFAATKNKMKIVKYLVQKGAQITKAIIDEVSKEEIKQYLQEKMNGTSKQI